MWTERESVLVASMSRGVVYEVEADGGVRAIGETGGSPNGLALGPDGEIWVAQNGGGHLRTSSTRPVTPSIQRIADGVVDDVITNGLTSPNDCTFGPDGRLWFTDPRGDPFGAEPTAGRVCALDTVTLAVETMADGPLFPNGLAFSADGRDFYLAETTARRVLHAEWSADGLAAFDVFAEVPSGEPDGMALDDDGNLLVASASGNEVHVFDQSGRAVDRLKPANGARVVVTNLCLGGSDRATLFVTVLKGGRLMACRWIGPGIR